MESAREFANRLAVLLTSQEDNPLVCASEEIVAAVAERDRAGAAEAMDRAIQIADYGAANSGGAESVIMALRAAGDGLRTAAEAPPSRPDEPQDS